METRVLTRRLGLEKAFDLGLIASFRSPANQAAQVSLVSGGLLPDYDKCQAYNANVHRAFRSGS